MSAHDERYRAWLVAQGPAGLDREARIASLPWRHRVLLRRYPVRGLRVLDYGCGDGIFALVVARTGATVIGFDLSTAAIEQARRFGAGETSVSFTTEAPAPGGFDLVFCNEVLEHVADDRAFAVALVACLRPGGRLVGTTPVGRAFWDPDHKRAYDAASLTAVLAPLGTLRLRRWYRTPLRNWLPWPQRGAAVFLFEVLRPA